MSASCATRTRRKGLGKDAHVTDDLLDPFKKIPDQPRELIIKGMTNQGRVFRPSDWAERLAGAMSCFRPGGGKGGIGANIGYSPYCMPRAFDDLRCVVVNERIKAIEPMAWQFVMNFARDNDLQVIEACLLPEAGSQTPAKTPQGQTDPDMKKPAA